MPLNLKGYVVEPPRVGASNSPFTLTPNLVISDQAAFDLAYPISESAPRTEYLVFVLHDGDLWEAVFAWTKNEGSVQGGVQVPFQRFDYDGREGRFKPLPGSFPLVTGSLSLDSNVTRLKVTPPVLTSIVDFPIRISVGSGSGVSFNILLVADDASFGVPPEGTVEISLISGNLNWSILDLQNFSGQSVRFQGQSFYGLSEASSIGVISDVLLLNPLPILGQIPLIRIGFQRYLTAIGRVSEAEFSADPVSGTVEWASDTGRLKFSSIDIAQYPGSAVYYDGVVFDAYTMTPAQVLGQVDLPAPLNPIPSEDADVFFRTILGVQFSETVFVDVLDPVGKRGVAQIRRADGQVQFSSADIAQYGNHEVSAYIPDLPIERGLNLRVFRTPVDLEALDSSLKDVSAVYSTSLATLADPIIQSPSVVLPAISIEGEPLEVRVEQGSGSFTGLLPRLDVPAPNIGVGYVLDYEGRQLQFARRREGVVIPSTVPYGAVQLPDPLLFRANLSLQIETSPSSGIFEDLVIGESAVVDYDSGLVNLVETRGQSILSSVSGSLSGAVLTDLGVNFIADGVEPDDLLVVTSGAAKGVYSVVSVDLNSLSLDAAAPAASGVAYEVRRGSEVLADRYFTEVLPVDPNTRIERIRFIGTATNALRLSVDPGDIDSLRLRVGLNSFLGLTPVVDSSAFSDPLSMPSDLVEVALDDGDLNFNSSVLGSPVYSAKTLRLMVDYKIQPALGFIELADRMLENEEVFATYLNADGVQVQERCGFAVRKELVQPHPTVTMTLSFNPLGREVSEDPSVKVYRGGRPQSRSQISVDYSSNTITFPATSKGTNALPSGPVSPSENVYVDYFVYGAIGGEKTVSLRQPPIQGVNIIVSEGTDELSLAGDHTGEFAANSLMIIGRSEIYLVESVSYVDGQTVLKLNSRQTFRSDLRNPSIFVSSGPVRLSPSGSNPSYFVTELALFESVPRGSDRFRLIGDVVRNYSPGTVIAFSGQTLLDLNIVQGSSYDPFTGKTEVVLVSNCLTQYSLSSVLLKRSVRPILEGEVRSLNTRRSPEMSLPTLVYRRLEGNPGVLLSPSTDYTLDASGRIEFSQSLLTSEEFVVLYTGATISEAGRAFKASYTCLAVPDQVNGLLGQVLKASYSTYIPDSFFWRVETITNLRGELAEQYSNEAKASVPTAGPILENSGGTTLYTQGRESVFFEEGRLFNEDIVARGTLKYYNDVVNSVDDILELIDGTLTGEADGKFLFDGNIDNPPRDSFDQVTNQIDDRLKVSPAPYALVGPPFVVTSIGTYIEAYRPSPYSRFYPTKKSKFGVTVDPSSLSTGDALTDLGVRPLTNVESVQRRVPWAITTRPTLIGETVIHVDHAEGFDELVRPSFGAGMVIAINGFILDSDGVTVVSTTPDTIVMSSGAVDAIPAGVVIRLSTEDTVYRKVYRVGTDLGFNAEEGLLTYVKPYPPLDGSVPLVPAELCIQTPGAGEALDATVYFNNGRTDPERFPALDGLGLMDDGGVRIPPVTGSSECEEAIGYIDQELALLNSVTGALRLATTPSFEGVGSLDAGRTVLTNTGGNWVAPIPKVYDLVRISSGTNSSSVFRRIVVVGANTITVDGAEPWPFQDDGFIFSITVSALNVSGNSAVTADTLEDLTKDFSADGILPGHTIVFTSGLLAGQRRQVSSVTATLLGFEPDIISPGAYSYRIDNPLGTFGSPSGSSIREIWLLENSFLGEQVMFFQMPLYNVFFNTVFDDIESGSADIAGNILTDLTKDFVAAGVNSSSFIRVTSAPNAGVYKVESVISPTQIQVEGGFLGDSGGQNYRVARTVGVSLYTLNVIDQASQKASAFYVKTQDFRNKTLQFGIVSLDPDAFSTLFLSSDLDARESDLEARRLELVGPSGLVSNIRTALGSVDRLYDKRFAWISARINLEKGILPKKQRAQENRIKAQAGVLNQLIKLLTVQT